jgi:hypothetical protein
MYLPRGVTYPAVRPTNQARLRRVIFAENAGSPADSTCALPEAPMLLLDAEPSREERGHRGVRPRHPRVD